MKWSKKMPTKEGWYWMKYGNKRRGMTICPAQLVILGAQDRRGPTYAVRSAFNDSFFEGPCHGGPDLKYDGKLDKSIRFGPKIELPA